NLAELRALVRASGADLGVAVDPDVDRLAIVDETGAPIGEDYTLAFAVRAVLGKATDEKATEGRKDGIGMRGKSSVPFPSFRHSVVVCNLSTSLVVEAAARGGGDDLLPPPGGEVEAGRSIGEVAPSGGGGGEGGL